MVFLVIFSQKPHLLLLVSSPVKIDFAKMCSAKKEPTFSIFPLQIFSDRNKKAEVKKKKVVDIEDRKTKKKKIIK